jgi:glycosyltransferase involved in cell wall biosynthesis
MGRRAVGDLANLIRRRRPDVVLGWLPRAHMYLAPAARLARSDAAVAWWQHHVPTGAAFERLATTVPADAVICSSHAAADAQRALRPARRCVVCHPGIEPPAPLGRARMAELRERAGIPAGRPVLAIVGRQVSWKGQDRFVTALSRLVASGYDVHGVIVGGTAHDLEPEYAERVRRLVGEAGLEERCTLTGHVDDPLPWVELADVLVSASEPEPFGLTLLEAMAFERAVLAVGRGGPAEIVEHGRSGWLVPDGTPESLAGGMRTLLDDPALRARLAAGGRARYGETFTAEAMGDRLAAILRELSRARA